MLCMKFIVVKLKKGCFEWFVKLLIAFFLNGLSIRQVGQRGFCENEYHSKFVYPKKITTPIGFSNKALSPITSETP